MIKDLPINTNGRLTGDAKKQLALIIEQEFTNKESLYHQVQEQEKKKIIEIYRKSVRYDKLLAEYHKAERKEKEAKDQIEQAKKNINIVGLTIEGDPDSIREWDKESNTHKYKVKAIELQEKLNAIEKNAPSQNLKAKLLSRIWLATTIGEANEIMREILGNGIIPNTNLKAITFQQ